MYFIFDLHIGGFVEVRMTIPYQKVNAISCNSTGGEDDQKTQVAINDNTLKLLYSLVGFSQAWERNKSDAKFERNILQM